MGNTQATLNSIYNPTSLSQFGINNFTSGPQIASTSWIDDCTQSLFGVSLVAYRQAKAKSDGGPAQNGSFTGVKAGVPTGPGGTGIGQDAAGPYQFTVTTELMPLDQVDKNWRAAYAAGGGTHMPPPTQKIPGYTDLSQPYTNYDASDDNYAWQTQIWELGNSLGSITGRGNRYNGEVGYDKTNENGKLMWQCYYAHQQLYK